MGSFPAIFPGLKINPLGKTGLPSRYKGNVIAATTNATLNGKIVRGDSDQFRITPNGMTIQLKRDSSTSALANMHPFKVYPTGTLDGSDVGYNVRSGVVDVRYLFHDNNSPGFNGPGIYASRVIPENVDSNTIPPSYTPNPIPSDSTFFFDPTAEIGAGDVNYGAYYSLWIEITPDTDNGSTYDGTVEILAQRFSIGDVPTDPFPGIGASGTGVTAKEYIPLAIVQVTAATDALYPVPGTSSSGIIYQIVRDNLIQRYPYNPYYGYATYWGEWGIDSGVDSGQRRWYPGDWIYFSGTPDATGYYMCHSYGFAGGTPSSPLDGPFKLLRSGSDDPD